MVTRTFPNFPCKYCGSESGATFKGGPCKKCDQLLVQLDVLKKKFRTDQDKERRSALIDEIRKLERRLNL